ncbi:MAG TPA: hypothetical protein VGI92_10955 [Gemmatimonadales bacterium]|jgi:hypothetical protein
MARYAHFGSSLVVALLGGAHQALAQQTPAPAPHRTVVCAAGVRTYDRLADVPAPFDTLRMPPGPPMRVNNDDEAREADRLIRERAGSIGATGIVIADVTDDDGTGGMRVHRSITPVFVAADTVRAQAACHH